MAADVAADVAAPDVVSPAFVRSSTRDANAGDEPFATNAYSIGVAARVRRPRAAPASSGAAAAGSAPVAARRASAARSAPSAAARAVASPYTTDPRGMQTTPSAAPSARASSSETRNGSDVDGSAPLADASSSRCTASFRSETETPSPSAAPFESFAP